MPPTINIELKNLRFFAGHGWHDEEAVLGNEFEVTILAMFPAKEEIRSIDDTVDYTRIYALVKSIFLQREKLLETIAQNMATAIEREFSHIQRLQISITKLTPPIPSFTGTVGITYSKEY
jgi:dihydroneopterin aldolase